LARWPTRSSDCARPASGIPVDYSFVPVVTFRAGKIVRMERYDDWETALAAMGAAD
jgi:ketosteroid isomerase-like protein